MREAGDYAFLWAWEPIRPENIAEVLSGFAEPWWICGGWALDMFLDVETRRHDDLDVAILRRDQVALHEHLGGWDLRYATADHTLEPWDGQHLDPPIHGIWARRSRRPPAPWTCEFLLNEHWEDTWTFGRDERVSRPVEEIGDERNGVPFLRPEIVLLYKSSEPSPKNDTDFAAVRPHLSLEACRWLRAVIERSDDRHPWLRELPAA